MSKKMFCAMLFFFNLIWLAIIVMIIFYNFPLVKLIFKKFLLHSNNNGKKEVEKKSAAVTNEEKLPLLPEKSPNVEETPRRRISRPV